MPTILVADDNSNIQKMVANALRDKGIDVIGVANGDAAIKKLDLINPDMVLADVFMPVKDGYELCEWIKANQRLAAVPVFLLVGAFDPLDEQRVQGVKADGVLKKPFVPPDHLIGAVSAMLDRAAKSRAAAEMQTAHDAFASSVPHVEDTQKLSDEEIAASSRPAAPAPPPEPEPEMEMYSTRPARLAYDENEAPVGFDDLSGTAADEESEEGEGPAFRPAGMDYDRAAAVETGGGIIEEARQPSPDAPPIKVDFSGGDDLELVTSETPGGLSSLSSVEAAPLPELVRSGEDVGSPLEAAAPPPPPPAAPLEMRAPIPEVRIPEPEPESAGPMGVPASDLPGLSWSQPAAAASAPMGGAAAPPAAPAPAAPTGTPEIVTRMMPLSPAQQDALVDEVVDRIISQIQPQIVHRITSEIGKGLETLQPQLLDRITKEVIRPLAEEMFRKKTEG